MGDKRTTRARESIDNTVKSRPIINNDSSSSSSNTRIISMHLVHHQICNTIGNSNWMRVLLVVQPIVNLMVLFLHSHNRITLQILISGIKIYIHNSILVIITIVNISNIGSIIVLLQLLPSRFFFLVLVLVHLLLLLLLLLPKLQPVKW